MPYGGDIQTYITQKFASYGYELTQADIQELNLRLMPKLRPGEWEERKKEQGWNFGYSDLGEENLSPDRLRIVEIAMAEFIPQLLLSPASVSENGFSVTRNVQGLKDYHAFLCRKHGLKNLLDDNRPKIRFL